MNNRERIVAFYALLATTVLFILIELAVPILLIVMVFQLLFGGSQ